MIRNLRARHRRTFFALTALLPVGLVVALTSRNGVPANAKVLGADSIALPSDGAPVRETYVKSPGVELRMRVWKTRDDGACALELTPARELELPDVLVYWADSDATDELPQKCTLLGAFAGNRPQSYLLRRDSRSGAGRLYIYSLGHQRLVVSLELPK